MKQLSWLSSLQPLKRVGVREDVHSLLILLISTIGIVHCFTEITQLESVCLLSPPHPSAFYCAESAWLAEGAKYYKSNIGKERVTSPFPLTHCNMQLTQEVLFK